MADNSASFGFCQGEREKAISVSDGEPQIRCTVTMTDVVLQILRDGAVGQSCYGSLES